MRIISFKVIYIIINMRFIISGEWNVGILKYNNHVDWNYYIIRQISNKYIEQLLIEYKKSSSKYTNIKNMIRNLEDF